MHVKTVNVTNPRNVLVQVPSFVIANWGVALGSHLEVHYDEEKQQLTIVPSLQRRSNVAGKSDGVACATAARAN